MKCLHAFLPLAWLASMAAGQAPPPAAAPPAVVIPPVIASPAQPLAPLESYFTSADYPALALAARQQGRVGVLLQVSAQGRVTRCTVTEPSGAAVLDSTSCAVMVRRARFSPALDTKGKPMTALFSHRVRWQMAK